MNIDKYLETHWKGLHESKFRDKVSSLVNESVITTLTWYIGKQIDDPTKQLVVDIKVVRRLFLLKLATWFNIEHEDEFQYLEQRANMTINYVDTKVSNMLRRQGVQIK